jgi:hypothetical protein
MQYNHLLVFTYSILIIHIRSSIDESTISSIYESGITILRKTMIVRVSSKLAKQLEEVEEEVEQWRVEIIIAIIQYTIF